MPRKSRLSDDTLATAEPSIPVAVQEEVAEPLPVSLPMATHVTITVKQESRWFSIQSGGVWFVKNQPAMFSISDPGLAEWRANSHLLVEEV